jgi:murein DD-endopeptidase MepM/ murein hydrolase activator NlpD
VRGVRHLIVTALAGGCVAIVAAAPASAHVAPDTVVEEVVKGLQPSETTTTTSTTTSETSSTTSPEPPAATTTTESSSTATSTSTEPSSTVTSTTTTTTVGAPTIESSTPQARSSHAEGHSRTTSSTTTSSTTSSASKAHARRSGRKGAAVTPQTAGKAGLPPLPFALKTPISGVPGLFIESLDVPPFLLPIYQAAGIAYEVPWEVLAAINEVETDYGNDLALSSAGAEGWMQFLPAEWREYGVDATGSGWKDPDNPEDAIFAAARYLQAAGASRNIRSAIFAYNHSQAYVEAVMLRARLLEQMPPDLLGAVTNLAEARFPVHAPAHFSDGFAAAPTGSGTRQLVGTTIYSEAGAPVIAVKDGTITAMGTSPALGRYVSLRDADGNTYTYAQLGSLATLYPLLRPTRRLGTGVQHPGRAAKPEGPASAGAQPRSPATAAGVTEGLALGAAGRFQGVQPRGAAKQGRRAAARRSAQPASSFREGTEQVQLEPLQVGVKVIAGTVLGHLASGAAPHVLFQIKPTGLGAPLIDPKPVLDGWVQLEDTGVFAAKGEDPFLATSPTAGQALFESAGALGQQILRDDSIALEPCERAAIRAGRAKRSTLASIELLALSGLRPSVAHLGCDVPAAGGLSGYRSGEAYDITAVDGLSIVSHAARGGIADATERKLLALQATLEPQQVAGPIDYPGAERAVVLPASSGLIHVSYAPSSSTNAQTASRHSATASAELTGEDWTALVERLAELPYATVSSQRSSASVADEAGTSQEVAEQQLVEGGAE